MRFIYHNDSGDSSLTLEGAEFHHIFGVRRGKNKGSFKFANMRDSTLYTYNLRDLGKKSAIFDLESSVFIEQSTKNTHIILAIIDMGEFSKILPMLNELLVSKITLFYSQFSQQNQKINIERLQKILINSSMQCGRLSFLEIEKMASLSEVLAAYPNAVALDFEGQKSENLFGENASFIIGAEGGFSQNEREILGERLRILNHSAILRATTACVFVASNKIVPC